MQKEIRSLLFKQQQRNADQQIGVCGGLIQRNGKIVLYSADTVKHRISMGKKGIAGLLQRSAAGQIMIKRFAILCVLFFYRVRQAPGFLLQSSHFAPPILSAEAACGVAPPCRHFRRESGDPSSAPALRALCDRGRTIQTGRQSRPISPLLIGILTSWD